MTASGDNVLAEKFEQSRGRLRTIAYRMLGSTSEADDAVQEAWLRLNRSDANAIGNLTAWLTTVVARVCLDMLRSRAARRDETLDQRPGEEPGGGRRAPANPEQEAILADSVGLAMLVVLDSLTPAERIAFVLHDAFAVPFEEIAAILGRSPAAVRQLASRARKRVRGRAPSAATLAPQRQLVEAFLAALRAGDMEGIIAVLDSDVVVRIDEGGAGGGPVEIQGAANWARGAVAFRQQAQAVSPALVNGTVGLVWAPSGRLRRALRFTFAGGKIAQAEIIGKRDRLRQLEIAPLDAA